VARRTRAGAGTAAGRNRGAGERGALDFVRDERLVPLRLVSGRGHYEQVIEAVRGAKVSVWIATATLKELLIEDGRARPGVRRGGRAADTYRSVLEILDELAARGVELRLLHAELPSRPFRKEIDRHERLLQGGLDLRLCPRVHFKAVIVDGAFLYMGSANWTGAGLGAKGTGRRNFELGVITSDPALCDDVQATYDRVFRGGECGGCRLRDVCPEPLDTIDDHA
jgi:phosphatidylserine/phosphatidylglycerophosphate/cardiolipin synthase-like enzyme